MKLATHTLSCKLEIKFKITSVYQVYFYVLLNPRATTLISRHARVDRLLAQSRGAHRHESCSFFLIFKRRLKFFSSGNKKKVSE